ncbi:MAG: hypothetical protein JO208_07320 [Alphaproteobacteria bacterium]|nr:hypothetical protein [Alphaproteobacteria bacterium]
MYARTTVSDARRYTRFVRVMKRVLLVAAGALVLAILVYVMQPRDPKQYAMTFEHLARVANDLTMLKARLTGTDSDNSPFVVTADKAVQDPHSLHRARLFNVEADMSARGGTWYNIRAPRGFLDTEAQKLWLTGNLAMFSDSGYELHTESAFIDLAPACGPSGRLPPRKAGKPLPRCSAVTVRGDHEVTGHGPLGTMRADRFHAVKSTKHLYLQGHVRMVLYPVGRGA